MTPKQERRARKRANRSKGGAGATTTRRRAESINRLRTFLSQAPKSDPRRARAEQLLAALTRPPPTPEDRARAMGLEIAGDDKPRTASGIILPG